MRITVYRGAKEIGGNCVEIATASTRIILDIGMPLVNPDRSPFDGSRVRGKSTAELLAEGIVPGVPGLFETGFPAPDAILLSHAHLDHVGLLDHSLPSIPVYATCGTSKMMLAGRVFCARQRLDATRYRAISSEVPFTVGDMRITPYAVDHSIFGSVAFLVEAGNQSILYSGDLRSHGRKPGMMRRLVERVAPKNVDLLLVEGTHLGMEGEKGIGEFELEEKIVGLVDFAPALVLACFSPQDLDRVVTLYRVSRRTKRIFVADAYTAFILHLVHREAKIPPPKREHGIRVYFNRSFARRNLEKLERLFEADRIELEEILDKPREHLMVYRPSMTGLDFAGKLPDKARVIYGYWLGYLRNPDWIELRKQAEEAGGDFIPAHASGHIHTEDLFDFVRAIKAKRVVPIHSFEPQLLGNEFANVRPAQDGVPFEVDR